MYNTSQVDLLKQMIGILVSFWFLPDAFLLIPYHTFYRLEHPLFLSQPFNQSVLNWIKIKSIK